MHLQWMEEAKEGKVMHENNEVKAQQLKVLLHKCNSITFYYPQAKDFESLGPTFWQGSQNGWSAIWNALKKLLHMTDPVENAKTVMADSFEANPVRIVFWKFNSALRETCNSCVFVWWGTKRFTTWSHKIMIDISVQPLVCQLMEESILRPEFQ